MRLRGVKTRSVVDGREQSHAECPFVAAGSTGRRNTGVESLCWGFKLQGLTWSPARVVQSPDGLSSPPRWGRSFGAGARGRLNRLRFGTQDPHRTWRAPALMAAVIWANSGKW